MQSAHTEAIDYLDGFAVHWYWDAIAPPSLLDKTHSKFPDKFILNTESCLGIRYEEFESIANEKLKILRNQVIAR